MRKDNEDGGVKQQQQREAAERAARRGAQTRASDAYEELVAEGIRYISKQDHRRAASQGLPRGHCAARPPSSSCGALPCSGDEKRSSTRTRPCAADAWWKTCSQTNDLRPYNSRALTPLSARSGLRCVV